MFSSLKWRGSARKVSRLSIDASASLRELHTSQTSKVTDKWSGYFGIYDRLLWPYRDRNVTVLEIGIQNGGSLEVWSRYFKNFTRIVGVDIDPKCSELRYEDPKIQVVVGDINSPETLSSVKAVAPIYDIIIDDGSHTSGDIVRTFCRLLPLLRDDGVYVVEDMCCAYWGAFEGGLYHPASSMTFFKALADCINAEHWGTRATPRSHLAPLLEHHGADLNDDLLAFIHSVEIANAVVTIRKAKPNLNVMGPRVLSGQIASVNPAVAGLHGQIWSSDERDNLFAHSADNFLDGAKSNRGYCSCCEQNTEFWIRDTWLRDHYLCRSCGSIPRMRALQHVLGRYFPDWKSASLHESSPSNDNLAKYCARYSASQYFGNEGLGTIIDGVRNENLESLTFEDATFDLVVTMDVLEHVFNPDAACREIMRVLKPGGAHVFTAPKHRGLPRSYPRARLIDGKTEYLMDAEYHGNPIGDGRALVTWDYGDDFEAYLNLWSGYPTTTHVIRDRSLGLDGEYLEVFVIRKLSA